jgi:hypothetical protein
MNYQKTPQKMSVELWNLEMKVSPVDFPVVFLAPTY